MKVLIVCSGNSRSGRFRLEIDKPYVYEQVEAIRRQFDVEFDFFLINGRGIRGYLSNLTALREKVQHDRFDIVHAHYGNSGFLSIMQKSVPVVITFHGSDIDLLSGRVLSKIAMKMSVFNIFVTQRLAEKARAKGNFAVISCGVDLDKTFPVDVAEARRRTGLDPGKKYALFSSSFGNPDKNYELARRAAELVGNIDLLELSGFTREQVNLLMNAVDLLIVTSLHESGPLVVKEAVACGCPVVSVDVGDVREIIGGIQGCYLTSYDPADIAAKMSAVLGSGARTNDRNRILSFDNKEIARKVYDVYARYAS